jgi:hypothetical protein
MLPLSCPLLTSNRASADCLSIQMYANVYTDEGKWQKQLLQSAPQRVIGEAPRADERAGCGKMW